MNQQQINRIKETGNAAGELAGLLESFLTIWNFRGMRRAKRSPSRLRPTRINQDKRRSAAPLTFRQGDTPIGRAVSDALAAFLRRAADDGGHHMFHGWQLAEAHLSDFSPYSARLMSETVDLKFVDEYGGDD